MDSLKFKLKIIDIHGAKTPQFSSVPATISKIEENICPNHRDCDIHSDHSYLGTLKLDLKIFLICATFLYKP